MPLRVGVLASGEGGNLQALLDSTGARRGDFAIVAVAGDRPAAFALERARRAAVPTFVATIKKYPDRRAHEQQLATFLSGQAVDLVVCAGYMRVFTSGFLAIFPNRVINLHPSLLPLFPGIRAISDILQAGVRVTGCTVHLVTEDLDAGPILGQRRVPILAGASLANVEAAVHAAEHQLLPAVVLAIADGMLDLDAVGRNGWRPYSVG